MAKLISDNLSVGKNGRLFFRGHDTLALAEKYSTPLYLMDEQRIRENMGMYVKAFRESFGPGSLPIYAGKANSFKRIYQIAKEEGMGIDAVSAGELYTAMKAGFPMERAFFQGTPEHLALCEEIAHGMHRSGDPPGDRIG